LFFFASLLLIFFLIRLWLSGFGGVHPDEAYYWTWSLSPQLGYFDHPPMIAWVIATGRFVIELLVPFELQTAYPYFFSVVKLKAGPYFLSTVACPLVIGKCIEWVQRAPLQITQMFALILTPVFLMGPQIVTPDTPFFLGWSLCLLSAIGFQRRRYHNHVLGDPTPPLIALSVISGAALAFSAYSKYSAILAAFLLVLSGCGLWNAMMMGLVCLSFLLPYFLWLASHGQADGAGVVFQLSNALGDPFKPNNFKFMGDLWASQVVFWTPLVFLSTFVFLFADTRRFFISGKSSHLSGTLFLWAITPLLFFSLTALKRPAEANWPLVGFVAAIVMSLARLHRHLTRLWILIFQNVLVVVLGWMFLTHGPDLAHYVEFIQPKLAEKLRKPSRLHEFSGWDRLHTLLEDTTRFKPNPILVESYQLYSSLLFIDSSRSDEHKLLPRLFFWTEGSRPSEFNRQAQYLLPEAQKNKAHWKLLRSSRQMENCRLYQTLLKEASEVYFLYECEAQS
jgi:hypothetical protein